MILNKRMQKVASRVANIQHLLFVYGTLRKGEEAHFKMDGSVDFGTVKTSPNYKIIQEPTFIGLIDGNESVQGELYGISSEKLFELDNWEDLIFRRSAIILEDGRVADCYKLQKEVIQKAVETKS
jgi:gamma-glutamylcyclotransferase (GGCT)/AIG2-like uncharacterized protein YtfP